MSLGSLSLQELPSLLRLASCGPQGLWCHWCLVASLESLFSLIESFEGLGRWPFLIGTHIWWLRFYKRVLLKACNFVLSLHISRSPGYEASIGIYIPISREPRKAEKAFSMSSRFLNGNSWGFCWQGIFIMFEVIFWESYASFQFKQKFEGLILL